MTTRVAGVHDMSIGYDMSNEPHIIRIKPASQKSIDIIMKSDETSMDGRSNWLWLRLPDGDLIFGCYPEGDTYFATEDDHP